jgi:hypothetical protein
MENDRGQRLLVSVSNVATWMSRGSWIGESSTRGLRSSGSRTTIASSLHPPELKLALGCGFRAIEPSRGDFGGVSKPEVSLRPRPSDAKSPCD